MNVAIIADDLTGAADSGVQLARSGYRTAVAFRGIAVPPVEGLGAVAVDTDSRHLPAGFAAKRVVEAGHAVREARVVYKKIDSTLRGPIPAELAAALGAIRSWRPGHGDPVRERRATHLWDAPDLLLVGIAHGRPSSSCCTLVFRCGPWTQSPRPALEIAAMTVLACWKQLTFHSPSYYRRHLMLIDASQG